MNVAMVSMGGRCRSVRVLGVVALAAVAALIAPWQADAQLPTPIGEIPVPTTLPRIMGGGGGGVTPPVSSPTTTVPAPAPPTTVPAAPVVGSVEEPRTPPPVSSSRTPSGSSRRGSSTGTADAPNGGDPTLVERVGAEKLAGPAIARLRRVTVPAARQFGFPLVLGAFVLAFLVVQGRLDARDPKLAAAPVTVDDDLLPFL